MKIKRETFLAALFSLAFATTVHALNPQDWIKKVGEQKKGRRVTQKHTTVAAVRGIEEPGQVDPKVRNYEAVKEMEKRNISKERVLDFIREGQLTLDNK